MPELVEIRGAVELPAHREDVTLTTLDRLTLVGELATPLNGLPAATLITLHPLPTHGGFMDSHIIRKAAARLPALAGLAVLRFNTRGTSSPRGTSEGVFGDGVTERFDLEAAVRFVRDLGLPHPWLVGWSFGTEVVIKYGLAHDEIEGVVLLSPPLHRATRDELSAWRGSGKRMVVMVPEHDDFLRPAQAEPIFREAVPEAEFIAVPGAKHLWVGEAQTRTVLTEIVRATNPSALPMPDTYAL
ncbi:alpha/beta hydrolase [Gryllotalpicola reticulitermitis]|uniref:Alpha/beta hydrolase n=1 Tax=Gryllotalpicola reticulitermitis TaxID=1184153 RepID=A0ABV8Q499_9MICO